MPLTAGVRLGNYEIVGPLGQGGMGEVYRAKDTKLGREVAIKVLPAAFAQHPERLARFEREAKILASLNHPNIAILHALEESSEGMALVMELVQGQTLNGPIPVETALKYAAQIASALDAAHEKGIIHRDLKPANITVTPSGIVKVLDFGLAVASLLLEKRQDRGSRSRLGQTRAILGISIDILLEVPTSGHTDSLSLTPFNRCSVPPFRAAFECGVWLRQVAELARGPGLRSPPSGLFRSHPRCGRPVREGAATLVSGDG